MPSGQQPNSDTSHDGGAEAVSVRLEVPATKTVINRNTFLQYMTLTIYKQENDY